MSLASRIQEVPHITLTPSTPIVHRNRRSDACCWVPSLPDAPIDGRFSRSDRKVGQVLVFRVSAALTRSSWLRQGETQAFGPRS
jgi:hypothetical protein